MSHAVRRAGFTVALVGTGGDELFGAIHFPRLHRWSQRLRWLPRRALERGARLVASALPHSNGEIPSQTRWAKLPEMIDGLPAALRARLEEETRARTPMSAIGVLEQRVFLGERLLRNNDAASMVAPIEQRLPLVDHVLFRVRLGDARGSPVSADLQEGRAAADRAARGWS
jgi:asparagine synthase (glutamine-hydrolysing)